MTKQLEVPEDLYEQLLTFAQREGCTIVEWIEKRVAGQLPASQGESLYDRMKPLIGSVQGTGENLSERHSEVVAEILDHKHRKEHP